MYSANPNVDFMQLALALKGLKDKNKDPQPTDQPKPQVQAVGGPPQQPPPQQPPPGAQMMLPQGGPQMPMQLAQPMGGTGQLDPRLAYLMQRGIVR